MNSVLVFFSFLIFITALVVGCSL